MTTNDLGLTDKNGACTCGTGTDGHSHAHSDMTSTAGAATNADYLVTGMTCSHCVASVSEELQTLDGVESVAIELNVGGPSKVTVASAAPLDRDAVSAAIDEAGYSLVIR